MIGSKEYDPKNNDWACNEDYVPINKYLQLNINKSKVNSNKFLGLVKTILLKEIKSKNILFNNIKYITTGFDDGDLNLIKD